MPPKTSDDGSRRLIWFGDRLKVPAVESRSVIDPLPALAITRLRKPVPRMSTANAATGFSPPVGKFWNSGAAPLMPEIRVTLFDPALTTATWKGEDPPWPALPDAGGGAVKLPTKIGPGVVPTGTIVGLRSLKKPLPRPVSIRTSFDTLSLI